ncbi:MAG: hypothetical protein KAI02_04715 [Gammaproteobacteria bacterium]|nr:hypothetical protein [Gammaproteobacteria bacterium]
MTDIQIRKNADAIEEQLDHFLDPVLSFRRSALGPAQQIATLSASEQYLCLHWIEIITSINAEFAYQYAAYFSTAVKELKHDQEALKSWTIDAMSAYDERGLQLAIKVLQQSQEYAEHYFNKQDGIVLEDIQKLLTAFVCGLNGRSLKIAAADTSYTDTDSIFLPSLISDYSTKKENFFYYKLLTVYQWSQNWFGSWRYELNEPLNDYHDPVKALRLFHCLESIRLLYKIRAELPGFFRQATPYLNDFRTLENDPKWHSICKILADKKASVDHTFSLLNQYYTLLEPIIFSFQGELLANKVALVKQHRISEEKHRFREALAQIVDEKKQAEEKASTDEHNTVEKTEAVFELKPLFAEDEEESNEVLFFELSLDGQPIVPPDDVYSLMSSIIQDIGEIPEDYLVAAGPGQYVTEQADTQSKKSDNAWSGVYHEEGAFFYDEWDYTRQHYKKNWCVVREMRVTPIYDDFVQDTVTKNIGIVKALRRNFEALKGEDRLLKRQVNGDDIDIDAVVESYAELSMGLEFSERVFTKMQREERNIAVMFMVDMSGSTQGWINQAERESLVLLCESLEMLGDRYAIYGFSGTTRKRCEIYHIKHLDEDYNDKVKARISGVSAKDYTRMGFAIRHLSYLLEEVDARTKLLITLSDGKPEDYDGQYRGEYGIEDTRQALFEVRQKGIHPYCITIDKEAGDYLPYMYGAANYVLIEDINKLPLKVSDIYRKLTT